MTPKNQVVKSDVKSRPLPIMLIVLNFMKTLQNLACVIVINVNQDAEVASVAIHCDCV